MWCSALIFLKYISDAFEELYALLAAGEGEYAGADPEDPGRVPRGAMCSSFPRKRGGLIWLAQAKQPKIGTEVDAAMDAIERDNPSLKGVLPKVYARQNLDPTVTG
jgi:type I restriction enzyme M protein